jgi:hypothetical protein
MVLRAIDGAVSAAGGFTMCAGILTGHTIAALIIGGFCLFCAICPWTDEAVV